MKTISIASDKLDDGVCDVALWTGREHIPIAEHLVISSRTKTVECRDPRHACTWLFFSLFPFR